MAADRFANKQMAVIGSGHMGYALVQGLIECGWVKAANIIVSNPSGSRLRQMQKEFGVRVTRSNLVAAQSDWIFIAVKPAVVKEVMKELSGIGEDKLIVSLAAGMTIKTLKSYVSKGKYRVVRIMPNIAVAYGEGVIGLFADGKAGSEVKKLSKLLNSLGEVVIVKREQDLDLLTVVAGCGPAVVARFMEMLSRFGTKRGWSKEISQTIAMQTFKGTIDYLEKCKLTPALLQQSVATKGGATEAILQAMKREKLEVAFHKSMDVGYTKLKETALKDTPLKQAANTWCKVQN